MITINVYNIYSQITGLTDVSIFDMLDKELSYFVQGYQFTKAFKTGWWDAKKKRWEKWDGKKHLLDRSLRFNTGLLSRVQKFLKYRNIDFTTVDHRKRAPFSKKLKTKNIQSRPYQDRVHEACIKHMGGIVKSATGSGKSIMITRLIADTNVKTIVYVIGVDLLYQMHETFEKFLGTKVGIIGDGIADIRNVNVCSVWTAASALGEKYETFDDEDRGRAEKINDANNAAIVKAIKAAEMIIFDECQFLAAQTLQTIDKASENAGYKYGFSGTPFRDDNADLLLEAVCGEQIVEITASELIKDGFLVQPTIHFINVPEFEGNLPEQYPSIYKKYIVENEVRNEKIINIALKLVEAGRKVLILVKNLNHGEILLDQLEQNLVVYFVRGDIDSDERNRVRQEFLKGKIDIIIASVVYDQGVDLPNLDALILAGSGKSSTRALQRIGRVIRPAKGKKDAVVVDFIDNAKYLLNHTAKRAEIYRLEAGFQIKLPKKDDEPNDDRNTNKTKKKKAQRKQVPPKDSGW